MVRQVSGLLLWRRWLVLLQPFVFQRLFGIVFVLDVAAVWGLCASSRTQVVEAVFCGNL